MGKDPFSKLKTAAAVISAEKLFDRTVNTTFETAP
jgi:hypothetical protein